MALVDPLGQDSNGEVAKAFINLNKAVMANHGKVTAELKRLVGFMASFTAGCQYCQAHSALAAERYGASQEKIWEYKSHTAFSEAEKAALDFAVAAASIPNAVNTEISKNLSRFWDESEIVEILAVVSLFGFLNRWNDSMATKMEDGAINLGNKYLKSRGWSVGKHT